MMYISAYHYFSFNEIILVCVSLAKHGRLLIKGTNDINNSIHWMK